MTAIRILHPGMLTTVQDLGRSHLRGNGLPSGGAIDPLSLRTANLLVGNEENAAALECALVGPVLQFESEAVVAVTGARVTGLPWCERIAVRRNGRIDLRPFSTGAYAYVAVAGGIAVPEVLGSHSTNVKLGFGGFDGRPLKIGDRLFFAESTRQTRIDLRISPLVDLTAAAPIGILDGKDAGVVKHEWVDLPFIVSSKSDRMGVRLEGPPLTTASPVGLASSVVLPGTIQLPPDGTPIALLADAQTLGGYPQIAHVITADLPRLAQIRPGQAVRFERVTLAEAHRRLRAQSRQLGLLRQGIRLKLEPP